METQGHTENNGHGGLHVCHKCGWPYPNPHPSSKIRRAHKKVCGTIEKYRLDNNAQDKTHVECYDGAPHSDKVTISSVERSVSRRRSNSGFGSRSSEDVFTDAGTEFSESPAVLLKEDSGGVMQRFYTMQRGNEFADTEFAEENPIAGKDNLCTTDRLKNNQLQTVEIMVGEKDKMEAATESHAHISGTPLVSPAVTPDIENVIDQNILQSSELSHELNVVSERVTDIIPSKVEPELRNSFTTTPEEMAGDEGQDAKTEHLTSVSLENKQEQSQRSVDEKKTFSELDHIFDANLSNADINIFKSEVVGELKSENSENRKDGSTEEKKPISSIGSISLEGATMDARETTSNADSLRNDDGKVSEDDITVQDSRNLLISDSDSNENITLEGAILNVKEIESSDKNARVRECMVDSGTDANLKTHDHLNSTSKKDVDVNVECSSQISVSVNHSSDQTFSDDTSCITDGDKIIKHAGKVSAVESVVDTGSVADSLDANWGSFSDAIPTGDTIASATVPNGGNKGKGIIVNDNTPLRMQLGKATARSRAESPIHPNQSSSSTSGAQNDVIPSTNDNRSLAKGEHTEMDTVEDEMEKEWNSPARYPVKRASKTRAYWMPFLCCSSVNAR